MAECNVKCVDGIEMMQGDSWPLEMRLLYNGEALKPDTVEALQLSVDSLTHFWPNGGVAYNEEKGVFAFWPTQEESFRLRGQVRAQARVKLKESGMVIGFDFGTIQIIESQSKEVL